VILALDVPTSPITPLSPPAFSDADESTPSPAENSKKASPLTDLIESEKLYVEFLTGVIRVRDPTSFRVLLTSLAFIESCCGMVAIKSSTTTA